MIKPGSIVKVKEWEEMETEFGLDEWGGIDCTFAFMKSMKTLCGMEFTIDYILGSTDEDGDDDGEELIPDYETCCSEFKNWSISEDMVKEVR